MNRQGIGDESMKEQDARKGQKIELQQDIAHTLKQINTIWVTANIKTKRASSQQEDSDLYNKSIKSHALKVSQHIDQLVQSVMTTYDSQNIISVFKLLKNIQHQEGPSQVQEAMLASLQEICDNLIKQVMQLKESPRVSSEQQQLMAAEILYETSLREKLDSDTINELSAFLDLDVLQHHQSQLAMLINAQAANQQESKVNLFQRALNRLHENPRKLSYEQITQLYKTFVEYQIVGQKKHRKYFLQMQKVLQDYAPRLNSQQLAIAIQYSFIPEQPYFVSDFLVQKLLTVSAELMHEFEFDDALRSLYYTKKLRYPHGAFLRAASIKIMEGMGKDTFQLVHLALAIESFVTLRYQDATLYRLFANSLIGFINTELSAKGLLIEEQRTPFFNKKQASVFWQEDVQDEKVYVNAVDAQLDMYVLGQVVRSTWGLSIAGQIPGNLQELLQKFYSLKKVQIEVVKNNLHVNLLVQAQQYAYYSKAKEKEVFKESNISTSSSLFLPKQFYHHLTGCQLKNSVEAVKEAKIKKNTSKHLEYTIVQAIKELGFDVQEKTLEESRDINSIYYNFYLPIIDGNQMGIIVDDYQEYTSTANSKPLAYIYARSKIITGQGHKFLSIPSHSWKSMEQSDMKRSVLLKLLTPYIIAQNRKKEEKRISSFKKPQYNENKKFKRLGLNQKAKMQPINAETVQKLLKKKNY